MGRSLRISLRVITFYIILLGSQFSWSTTVGLLVDKPSEQIQVFHQKLQAALNSDQITLLSSSQLNQAALNDYQKWITLGPNALDALLASRPETPLQILALFLPDTAQEKLLEQYPNTFSYLDNRPSLERQLALINAIMPQANHVGIYYSAMFKLDKKQYANAGKKYNLTLHWAELRDPLNWDRNAQKVLSNVDIVLGVDDSALYNATTIRSILMRLYRSGKALIGPDKGYVRAGAVASVYSGVGETLQAAASWVKQGHFTPGVIPNPYFDVSVNLQVARSLNIVIQDEAALVKAIQERANEK